MRRLLFPLLTFLLAPHTALAAQSPPNIIFILADDLGYGDVGVFATNRGDPARPALHTPHLDRMAAAGARLTDHYSAAPVCAPSRASLLLGRHQGHANIRDNQFDKALADNHTLATVLRQAGYATAVIGKWGLHGGAEGAVESGVPDWPAHPLKRGFDYFYGYMRHRDGHEHYPKEGPINPHAPARGIPNASGLGRQVWENRTEVATTLDRCYTTDLFAARAKQWIVDQVRPSRAAGAVSKPFFLYLSFDTPHAALQIPTRAYPAGGGLRGGLQWLGQPGHMINTAEGEIDTWLHPDYRDATYDDDRDPATPEKPWPDVYRRYATSVRRVDDCVGDLLSLLRDLGIDGRTLVVFSSDNGPAMESYLPEMFHPRFFASYGPFAGIKRDCLEGGLRVPTIAHWPGEIAAATIVSQPSAQWDWLATFAEAAGMPPPAVSDGVSLLPALRGQASTARRLLYFEYVSASRTPDYADFSAAQRNRPRQQMQAIRWGDLVGVRYGIKSPADDFEIYDIVHDPGQIRNLAGLQSHVDTQRRLQAFALQSRRSDPTAPRPYDGEFVPAVASTGAKPGLDVWRIEGDFPWVPDVRTLAGVHRFACERPDDAALGRGAFAVTFAGLVTAEKEGDYTFYLASSGRVVMRLHSATLIDADRGAPAPGEKQATIKLAAGAHPLTLHVTQSGGPASLKLEWSGPGFSRRALPAAALSHDDGASAR